MTGMEAIVFLNGFWQSVDQERVRMWRHDDVGETKFRAKYDSENGWGSLVGALVFMGDFTSACALYPHDKISVSA